MNPPCTVTYSIHRSSHGIPRPPFIPFSQSASFYCSENSSKEGIQDAWCMCNGLNRAHVYNVMLVACTSDWIGVHACVGVWFQASTVTQRHPGEPLEGVNWSTSLKSWAGENAHQKVDKIRHAIHTLYAHLSIYSRCMHCTVRTCAVWNYISQDECLQI